MASWSASASPVCHHTSAEAATSLLFTPTHRGGKYSQRKWPETSEPVMALCEWQRRPLSLAHAPLPILPATHIAREFCKPEGVELSSFQVQCRPQKNAVVHLRPLSLFVDLMLAKVFLLPSARPCVSRHSCGILVLSGHLSLPFIRSFAAIKEEVRIVDGRCLRSSFQDG